MKDVQEVLDNLQNSEFRRNIKLGIKESEYLVDKGLELVLEHAADFVEKRLAPAEPANDGKQTRAAIIRFSLRSTPRQRAAAAVSKNGTTFREDES